MTNKHTVVDIRVTMPTREGPFSLQYRYINLMREFLNWLAFRNAGLGVGKFETRNHELITWTTHRQESEEEDDDKR